MMMIITTRNADWSLGRDEGRAASHCSSARKSSITVVSIIIIIIGIIIIIISIIIIIIIGIIIIIISIIILAILGMISPFITSLMKITSTMSRRKVYPNDILKRFSALQLFMDMFSSAQVFLACAK